MVCVCKTFSPISTHIEYKREYSVVRFFSYSSIRLLRKSIVDDPLAARRVLVVPRGRVAVGAVGQAPPAPLELGHVLAEDVARPQGGDQVVELALALCGRVLGVLGHSVRLEAAQNALPTLLPLHGPLFQLKKLHRFYFMSNLQFYFDGAWPKKLMPVIDLKLKIGSSQKENPFLL